MGLFKDELTRLVIEMKSDVQVLELLTACVHESDTELIQGMKEDLIITQESMTGTREAMAKKYGMPVPEEAEKIYQHCMHKMDEMLLVLNNKLSKGAKELKND
jgi:hypothetical protein